MIDSNSRESTLKAPFPYFGGKRIVADKIWRALGQPKHYIEPFCGSCAVLLLRPDYDPSKYIETVNDADGNIANVWRSLKFDPDGVAEWADWPVNHADLSAKKRVLCSEKEPLLGKLIADPEFYDVKLAGYYIWAASCWIGSGMTRPNAIPHIFNGGIGIHAIGQIPHLTDAGQGVNAIGQSGHIYDWFDQLSSRLRRVRVICGDWKRVCGGNWQNKMGTCGIFFDPPYGAKATRTKNLYSVDSLDVADEVAKWAHERGTRSSYRIVLAGYFEEHEWLLKEGWTVERWKAVGGYGNRSEGQAKSNAHREALFYSPHCGRNADDFPLFEFNDSEASNE